MATLTVPISKLIAVSYGSTTNAENGIAGHTNTKAANFTAETGYDGTSKTIDVRYGFDVSALPENITINSISCTANASGYTASSYGITYSFRLEAKTSAYGYTKLASTDIGSNVTFGTTTVTATRKQLVDSLSLNIYVNQSYTTSFPPSVSFYGATVTIDYTVNVTEEPDTEDTTVPPIRMLQFPSYISIDGVDKELMCSYANIGGVWREIIKKYVNVSEYQNDALPTGYTALPYIESTGTQYIDTGIVPTMNTSLIIDAQLTSKDNAAGSSPYLYGVYESSSKRFSTLWNQTEEKFSSLFAANTVYFDNTDGLSRVTIHHSSDMSMLNNAVAKEFTATSLAIANTIYLFARHGTSKADYIASMKLYSCKIYEQGVLVRNYIPCKDPSGVIGLYDSANNTFNPSVGTSAFLAGTESGVVSSNGSLWKLSTSLPSELTAVEYIETTGTQYIDTGFIPNQDTRVVCKATCPTSSTNWLFGVRASVSSRQFGFYGSTSGYKSEYGSTTDMSFDAAYNNSDIMTIDKNKNITTLAFSDGTYASVTHTSGVTFTAPMNLFLGAYQVSSTSIQYSKAKIYSFQIYDNGTLIRDYIPCVHVDGTVGMFDRQNSMFYKNAGTGDFKAGWYSEPTLPLPSSYTQLNYIESSGTQYIDTGFKPSYNSRVVVDVSDLTTEDFIFGARDTASSTATNQFGVYISSASQIRSDYFGTNKSDTPSNITTRTIIDKDGNTTTAFGLTLTNTAVSSGSVTNTMYLFALNNAGTLTAMASMKLYSCKIYDNGELVRDFVPCANAGGVVGLYDKVNGVFYTNAGTGTFSAG